MIDHNFGNVENLNIQTHAQIQKIFDRFHNLKSKLLEYINQIQENLQYGIRSLILNLINQIKKIQPKLKNWITKISNALNKMKNCDQYQSCFNQLYRIHKEDSEIKLISTVVQQGCECNAISINKSGSLIETGDAEDIRLWEFKVGNMKRVQQLTKHPQYVSCLIFSRYTNSFISACKGGKIHCWQQTVGIGNFNQNLNNFNMDQQIIINFFSGSEANRIIVWKVDFESYQLTKMQELETQAQEEGLALSPSEWILASTLNNIEIAIYKNKTTKNGIFIQMLLKSLMSLDQEYVFYLKRISFGSLGDKVEQILFVFCRGQWAIQRDRKENIID